MVRVRYVPVSHLTRGQTLHNRRNVRAPRSLPPTQTLTAQPVVHVRSMKLAEPDSVSHRAAVSQSEPAAQLDSVSNSPSILQSESTVQADSVSHPRSALRSEHAAHTESVPLPTRKPKKASTAVRRIAHPQTRGAPSRIVAKARDVSGER
jgi:hypothetical protein